MRILYDVQKYWPLVCIPRFMPIHLLLISPYIPEMNAVSQGRESSFTYSAVPGLSMVIRFILSETRDTYYVYVP